MTVVLIMDSGASPAQQAAVLKTIQDGGGAITLGLGASAAVLDGSQSLVDSLVELVGDGLMAIVLSEADIPVDVDDRTAELVRAWLVTQSPAFLAEMADPARYGQSWESLESGAVTEP